LGQVEDRHFADRATRAQRVALPASDRYAFGRCDDAPHREGAGDEFRLVPKARARRITIKLLECQNVGIETPTRCDERTVTEEETVVSRVPGVERRDTEDECSRGGGHTLTSTLTSLHTAAVSFRRQVS
jgi:hypothetical protein